MSETKETTKAAWCGFIIASLIAFYVCMIFDEHSTTHWRGECVKRGIAEWVVNPANGKTTFAWKAPAEPIKASP